MNISESEGKVIIALEGRIDTNNAPQIEKQIFEGLEGKQGELIIDAKDLAYISSAGLRVLMKLCKSTKGTVQVINVSREIYDIFETTGFTELLDVRKALREVSVEGCELVGSGSYGKVYRLDDETIIKLYGVGSSELIERERLMSQRAFVNGLPTAISYDVVKCGDQLGVVYELLKARTVAQLITADPDNLESTVRGAVSELRRFHSIEINDKSFEDKKLPFFEQIKMFSPFLAAEEQSTLEGFLDSIPDRSTFVHGDYNFKNVMSRDGEILLIDVGDAGYGHPIFDLSGLALAYRIFAKSGQSPERIFGFLGIAPSLADRVWNAIISEYFNVSTPDEISYYTQMLMPMAEFIRAYHTMRRITDINDKQAVSQRVDTYIRGLVLPAIKNAIKLDF